MLRYLGGGCNKYINHCCKTICEKKSQCLFSYKNGIDLRLWYHPSSPPLKKRKKSDYYSLNIFGLMPWLFLNDRCQERGGMDKGNPAKWLCLCGRGIQGHSASNAAFLFDHWSRDRIPLLPWTWSCRSGAARGQGMASTEVCVLLSKWETSQGKCRSPILRTLHALLFFLHCHLSLRYRSQIGWEPFSGREEERKNERDPVTPYTAFISSSEVNGCQWEHTFFCTCKFPLCGTISAI